jgi:excisionase family DNA binding protein
MYLSVQLAARRLGVSPHTIRRWTASGFLPCTRTAGGHRRIKQEDIDDLAHLIGGSNHLAARLAREREVETLVETSIALSSRLDLTELLAEIAKRMTGILDCHFCAISDYDEATDTVRVLADFDHFGRRLPDWKPYSLSQFPFTKNLMNEQELATINVSDPGADPAETAIMRRFGDKSLLLIPLVYRGRSVGLLEVLDRTRERRFTRQELRLAGALAGQAAVALQNAKVFARLTRSDSEAQRQQSAIDGVIAGLPALAAGATLDDVLRETAALACRTLSGITAVATCGASSAGASGVADDAVCARAQAESAHVVSAECPAGASVLHVTVTLGRAPGEAQAVLLRLLTSAACLSLARLG